MPALSPVFSRSPSRPGSPVHTPIDEDPCSCFQSQEQTPTLSSDDSSPYLGPQTNIVLGSVGPGALQTLPGITILINRPDRLEVGNRISPSQSDSDTTRRSSINSTTSNTTTSSSDHHAIYRPLEPVVRADLYTYLLMEPHNVQILCHKVKNLHTIPARTKDDFALLRALTEVCGQKRVFTIDIKHLACMDCVKEIQNARSRSRLLRTATRLGTKCVTGRELYNLKCPHRSQECRVKRFFNCMGTRHSSRIMNVALQTSKIRPINIDVLASAIASIKRYMPGVRCVSLQLWLKKRLGGPKTRLKGGGQNLRIRKDLSAPPAMFVNGLQAEDHVHHHSQKFRSAIAKVPTYQTKEMANWRPMTRTTERRLLLCLKQLEDSLDPGLRLTVLGLQNDEFVEAKWRKMKRKYYQ